MGRFCPPSNLQVAAMKGLSLPPSLSVGRKDASENGAERRRGPIKRYSLYAIAAAAAATATRRNHSRLHALLSPLPKQSKQRATSTNSTLAATSFHPRYIPSGDHILCQCFCKVKNASQFAPKNRLLVGFLRCVYLPSNPDLSLSLSLPLAFIGLMNSIVISTANCAAWR